MVEREPPYGVYPPVDEYRRALNAGHYSPYMRPPTGDPQYFRDPRDFMDPRDPRYFRDLRDFMDPRYPRGYIDPRDPRILRDTRGDPRDPRNQDPRDPRN